MTDKASVTVICIRSALVKTLVHARDFDAKKMSEQEGEGGDTKKISDGGEEEAKGAVPGSSDQPKRKAENSPARSPLGGGSSLCNAQEDASSNRSTYIRTYTPERGANVPAWRGSHRAVLVIFCVRGRFRAFL